MNGPSSSEGRNSGHQILQRDHFVTIRAVETVVYGRSQQLSYGDSASSNSAIKDFSTTRVASMFW